MISHKIWECLVCGFVYDESLGIPEDNIAPGTAWDDIPDDWLCPDCGVGKVDFEMVEVKRSAATVQAAAADTAADTSIVPPAQISAQASAQASPMSSTMVAEYSVWECIVCGWQYDESLGLPEDNIAPGTRWDDIPEDWFCPDCGVGKQDFEMVEVKTVSIAATAEQPVPASATGAAEKPLVVIGAGLAAYNLIKAYRQLNSRRPITLICADDGSFYSKPQISTGFTKNRSAEAMITADATTMARDFSFQLHNNSRVERIDRTTKTVHVNGNPIAYGELVLALGANCIQAPLQGSGLDSVFTVNDLSDYAKFRAAVSNKKRVLVIGAGLIGSEYSNDLVQSGYQIEAVDPMPGVLGTLLPQEAAQCVQTALEKAGARFHFGTTVSHIERAETGVTAHLNNGERIQADIVLSAIGVRANTQLAADAGLTINRGICTDAFCRTSDPDIYALGDCAEVDGQLLYYVAPLMTCARSLAKTLAGQPSAVRYNVMPVAIKTTLHPVLVVPAPRDCEGEWQIDAHSEAGFAGYFVATDGTVKGFALTGNQINLRDAMMAKMQS
jgi:rubredoxin-NAD+ reductase